MTARTPSLRIKVFARYAELLSAEELTLPGDGIRTVADLLVRIRALPHGDSIAATALIAINQAQARPDTPISPGDEIALLPPLAGG